MKENFLKLLNIISSKLECLKLYLSPKEEDINDELYTPLSPINISTEESKKYIEALDWAIKTRKKNDIKNIALTGPYGAGKSSILKTYQNNYPNPDLHFLNISLATFKEEDIESLCIDSKKEENQKQGENQKFTQSKNNDIISKIEISILQQIFYHENDDQIPDSRFKKIRISNTKQIFNRALYILGAILSTLCIFVDNINFEGYVNGDRTLLFFNKTVLVLLLVVSNYFFFNFLKSSKKKLFFKIPLALIILNVIALLGIVYLVFFPNIYNLNITLIDDVKGILNFLSIIYLIIFSFFCLNFILKFIDKISVNKLKIQNAEIEIGSNKSKSIMNQHLDEILYFFSIRPYNVVIIEDLDRFKQTEIFTKLREINLLLNQSEKTKSKNIVFIYAVRDEMFKDQDRTKFFDFIIPVIPTINSSNSSEILLDKNSKNNLKLELPFIEKISYLIDDMRLLHNICNEYILYKFLLPSNLQPHKLFAIIAYKNLLPQDFIKLSKNEGDLYALFNNKKDLIKLINGGLDEEITEVKKQIENIKNNRFKDEIDLRRAYVYELLKNLNYSSKLIFNQQVINLDTILEESYFSYLINDQLEYQSNNISSRDLPIKFEDLEKKIHPTKTYKELLKEIKDRESGELELLINKIKNLENQKLLNKRKKIEDLLNESTVKLDNYINLEDNNKFLYLFLKNGYISEDYINYISIFHEGSISKNDIAFYLNVQNKITQDPDYHIDNLDNLIKRFEIVDFNEEYIYNYAILDHLLENNHLYSNQLNDLLNQIISKSSDSVDFLMKSIDNIKNSDILIKLLIRNWPSLFSELKSNTFIDVDQLQSIIILIIKNSDFNLLESDKSSLIKFLSDFPEVINKINDNEKLINFIYHFDIKLESINYNLINNEVFNFIIKNNHYQITIQNLENILKFIDRYDDFIFNNSNFKALLDSENVVLIDYHLNHFTEYLRKIYLQLPINSKEELECYYSLLNQPVDDIDLINLVIIRAQTLIENISKINSNAIKQLLLKNKKVKITWENIIEIFNTDPDENLPLIVNYLNDIEIAKKLADVKISSEKDSNGNYAYREFILQIYNQNDLSEESFKELLNSISFRFEVADFEGVGNSKIKLLIEYDLLKVSVDSFIKLEEDYNEFLILYIERNWKEVNKIIEEVEIDAWDLNDILNSKDINNAIKQKFLNQLEDEEILEEESNLSILSEIIFDDDSFIISNLLIKKILCNSDLNTDVKINIFIKNHSNLSDSEINKFLSNLNSTYKEIINTNKRVAIPKTTQNFKFLEILKEKEFINSYREENDKLRVFHKGKN